MQKVKRLNIEKSAVLSFDTVSSKWLVKNFSDNDLLVSFKEDALEDEWVKIPSLCFQVCMTKEDRNWFADRSMWQDKLYLKGTGEVEVQLLTWMA